ncbi:helix-turn-helix domain-containing protein [Tsukamurella pulmonis]|nr:helix-turn-helix domain-containing protein [Tsukamurella pulmonis]
MPTVAPMTTKVSTLIGALEASKTLGVSRSTVQRMALRGELSCERAPGARGGAFLFARADVEALAAERAK